MILWFKYYDQLLIFDKAIVIFNKYYFLKEKIRNILKNEITIFYTISYACLLEYASNLTSHITKLIHFVLDLI